MRPKEDYLGAHPLKRGLMAVGYFLSGLGKGMEGFLIAWPGSWKMAAGGLEKAVKIIFLELFKEHWSEKCLLV